MPEPKPLRKIEDDFDVRLEIHDIRSDISVIKENHLAHIEKDLAEIKTEFKEHRSEVNTAISSLSNKVWYVLIVLVGATVISGVASLLK